MKCPRCGLINPPTAMICDCGYNFETKSVVKPLQPRSGMKRKTAQGFLLASGILVLFGSGSCFLSCNNPTGEWSIIIGLGGLFGLFVAVILGIVGLVGLARSRPNR